MTTSNQQDFDMLLHTYLRPLRGVIDDLRCPQLKRRQQVVKRVLRKLGVYNIGDVV